MLTKTLAHHGVKGQKWGVRRTPEQLGHPRKHKKKSKLPIQISISRKPESAKSTNLNEKKASTGKRDVKSMSDDELRKAINRIEMERKYSTLTATQKSKGRKFVEEVLGNAAKQTATKYTSQAMSNLVDSMLKKATKNKS